MVGRNRSEGWRHAKLSGHAYEKEFARRVLKPDSDENCALRKFCEVRFPSEAFGVVSADPSLGGRSVPAFDGCRLTQSKADVAITLKSERRLKLSLKKPDAKGGQALLIKSDRFFSICKAGPGLPTSVRRAFSLFTGESALEVREHLASYGGTGPIHRRSGMPIERYQNRLYVSTLERDFPKEWGDLVTWVTDVMPWLTDVCLFRGLGAKDAGLADGIYPAFLRKVLGREVIMDESRGFVPFIRDRGYYSGSTLSLPWGFLQPHRPGKKDGPFQLQFHYELGMNSVLR